MSTPKPKTLRNNRLFVATIVLISFFVVFAGLIGAYIYKFDQQLTVEKKTQLSEVSNYIVSHMTSVVNDTQESLKVAAKAIALMPSPSERMAYLNEVAEQCSFSYMGYAGPDGQLHATIPSESVNIAKEGYFQAAIRNQSFVSDQIRKIFTHRAVSGIILSVPLREGDQQGALVAMLETKSLRDALSLESFAGEGYSYIIDKKGSVVMRTKSLDFGNLFNSWKGLNFHDTSSLKKFTDDVTAGRHGLTYYSNLVGAKHYAYYRSLPFNNWTAINIVSEQAVFAETITLTRELGFIGGSMILIFTALMCWAMRSQQLSHESRLAAEAKSSFLANMSHEIRTPMNAIVGLSEIMLRDEVSPAHRAQLSSILNSGKGLLTIINDILDISKLESGSFTIVDESYELESLLYDLTIISTIRIGEKPLQFLVDLDPSLPRSVVGDMGRVKQVLLNILSNAIKFTTHGSIRLIVQCQKDEQGWLLHVEVRDTGIGIKPEDIDKMFVRFSQVDTKRNRNIEGTGLGLTISQKLCQMMGGDISVQSEYKKGTSFFITLRQGVDEDDSPLIGPVEEHVSLLLYDTSQLVREFEMSCLEKIGVEYLICDSEEEFSEKLLYGNFSHALAPREVLRRLDSTLANKIPLIGLLGLREHSLINTGGTNIYLPLFEAQLPYALNGKMDRFCAPKHSAVDMDLVDPMPFVSVLIVDDNDLNIMVAEGLMAPYEMHLEHVISGREAVMAVQNRDFDLVLMDHMMPEMDGMEATQIIRSLPDEKFKKLPIVALTANTTTEARKMFLENGFNEFLAKPIETHKLNKVLRDWLKDINAQRAAVASSLPKPTRPLPYPPLTAEALPPPAPVPGSSKDASFLQKDGAEIDFNAGQKLMPSRAFYFKLLATYIRSTGTKLELLPDWMENDPKRLIIEIHGLKSASASIGATNFSQTASQLEMQGKLGQFDAVRADLPVFIDQGHRVLAEIKEFLQQIEDSSSGTAV